MKDFLRSIAFLIPGLPLGEVRPVSKQKSESFLQHIVAVILWPILGPRYMQDYFTTFSETIWLPEYDLLEENPGLLEHETVHVKQMQRWGVLFWILYLFGPLPVGFNYFRFRWERVAFCEDIKAGAMTVEEAVETLSGRDYGWPWPKAWVSNWFKENKEKWQH